MFYISHVALFSSVTACLSALFWCAEYFFFTYLLREVTWSLHVCLMTCTDAVFVMSNLKSWVLMKLYGSHRPQLHMLDMTIVYMKVVGFFFCLFCFLNFLKYFAPKAAGSCTVLFCITYALCHCTMIIYRPLHKIGLAYKVLNTIEFWSWNCNKGVALGNLNTCMGHMFCSCPSNSITNANHRGTIGKKTKTNPHQLATEQLRNWNFADTCMLTCDSDHDICFC